MFVKICGITTRDALEAAVEAGADAIGFVFTESVREISPHNAAMLCRDLPQQVRRIAVMRHPTQDQYKAVMNEFWPDWLQADAADLDELKLPPDCTPLPVYRDAAVKAAPPKRWPRRLIFEGMQSGQGELPDWSLAQSVAEETDLILAGGLNETNIVDAIRAVRPWGVDVSSGVEKARGVKCPRKIRQFIALARARRCMDDRPQRRGQSGLAAITGERRSTRRRGPFWALRRTLCPRNTDARAGALDGRRRAAAGG